jgi:vacuolar protein sorting-associated protein 45
LAVLEMAAKAVAAVQSLDLIAAVRNYVDKIVSDTSIGGMKALLLDFQTTKIVSMVYSQTQILEQEVYLVEQLGKRHEAMSHLKAAVFIQPTEANLDLLIKELRSPMFAEYHIFFSNIVPHDMLTRLGRADEFEVVRQVQEYYADYCVVNEDFFHLRQEKSLVLSSSMSRTLESGKIFDRNVQGILSVLLSIKRRPSQIRFQESSELARRIATDIVTQLERDDVFEFRRQEGPLLLILDRRDDPITPLLTQWTYQAMVHECMGLRDNRVDMKRVPKISKDLQEIVLSCTQDKFFAKHRHFNFGDLGEAIKGLMDDYQKKAKMNEKLTSIADMSAFMERYPAFRAQSINVSKHVALLTEMRRLIDKYQMFRLSELEQGIACTSEHSAHKRDLFDLLGDERIANADKIRLSLLYLIKYESYDEKREIKQRLAQAGIPVADQKLLDALLDYAGESKRAPNLFNQGGGIMSQLGKQLLGSIRGDFENVYTQHQPLLSSVLDAIAKGKLKDATYPLASTSATPTSRPAETIVFIVGGATFEEATKVAEFNANNPGLRVLLGGSTIHNSSNFLDEIKKTFL